MVPEVLVSRSFCGVLEELSVFWVRFVLTQPGLFISELVYQKVFNLVAIFSIEKTTTIT